MPILNLTPEQVFQNTINNLIMQISAILNPNNSSGIVTSYNRMYDAIFKFPSKTPAQVLIQLSSNGGNVLGVIKALNIMLKSCGVENLSDIPDYTINQDGTATLAGLV